MDAICNMPAVVPVNQPISVIDLGSNERKMEDFVNLPDEIKFKPKLINCNNVERTVIARVAEIRVSPLDRDGKLVPKDAAVEIFIEYLDKDGHILEVTRMTKN